VTVLSRANTTKVTTIIIITIILAVHLRGFYQGTSWVLVLVSLRVFTQVCQQQGCQQRHFQEVQVVVVVVAVGKQRETSPRMNLWTVTGIF
jgi:hypothetical protein